MYRYVYTNISGQRCMVRQYRVIRELESGKKLGQLSRENNIHPNMISRWKLEYDKDPGSAFKGNGNTYKDAARNEELERLVGKLYAENDF